MAPEPHDELVPGAPTSRWRGGRPTQLRWSFQHAEVRLLEDPEKLFSALRAFDTIAVELSR